MMRYYLFLILAFLVSCKNEITQEEISNLNGYWEIEKVELPNGETKDYKINESVDFFEINNNLKGFRKKLVPQFDGRFLTNEVNESITISFKDEITFINYSTEFASWTEEIKKLNKNELVLANEQGINYIYKRKSIENE